MKKLFGNQLESRKRFIFAVTSASMTFSQSEITVSRKACLIQIDMLENTFNVRKSHHATVRGCLAQNHFHRKCLKNQYRELKCSTRGQG